MFGPVLNPSPLRTVNANAGSGANNGSSVTNGRAHSALNASAAQALPVPCPLTGAQMQSAGSVLNTRSAANDPQQPGPGGDASANHRGIARLQAQASLAREGASSSAGAEQTGAEASASGSNADGGVMGSMWQSVKFYFGADGPSNQKGLRHESQSARMKAGAQGGALAIGSMGAVLTTAGVGVTAVATGAAVPLAGAAVATAVTTGICAALGASSGAAVESTIATVKEKQD